MRFILFVRIVVCRLVATIEASFRITRYATPGLSWRSAPLTQYYPMPSTSTTRENPIPITAIVLGARVPAGEDGSCNSIRAALSGGGSLRSGSGAHKTRRTTAPTLQSIDRLIV